MKTIISLAVIVFTLSQISFAGTQPLAVTTGTNIEKNPNKISRRK